MQALIIESPGRAISREAPVPAAGPGEVLIRVGAAGLCGTDLHIYRGEYMATYPIIPGHEFSGIVVALGEGVTDLVVGQRVSADPNIFCHQCAFCRREMHNQCLNLRAIGVNTDGAFAEYVVAPREVVYAIGDLPFEQAAFAEPLACVVYAMQRARPRPGDNVLLIGAGPMGCLLAHQHLGLSPGMSVLDAGCGPGRLTIPMAREVGAAGHVMAMDLQEGMLAEVRKRASREDLGNITYLQAGLGEGKLKSGVYDRAVLITVLGEVPDREAAMREICRSLRPGGVLLVEETIRDPHFQGRGTVLSLAGPLGLREKAFFGGRFNFTILLEKPSSP